MSDKLQIPDFLSTGQKIITDARRYAKVYCLQWFDDSFQKGGFTDVAFQPWDKRKEPDRREGGAILVDNTFLQKSLDVLSDDGNRIEFGSHVPYAGVHNHGLRVRTLQNVRAHHRAGRKGGRHQVKAHVRKMDTTFPKRQFIGHSTQMMKNLDTWVLKEIEKRFKEA